MLSKFKNIAIYSSIKSKKISQLSDQVEEIVKNKGSKVLVPKSSEISEFSSLRAYSDKYIINNADLVIAIGGDGTLLSSARKFGYEGLPILGINLGNLGFLTDVAPKDLTSSLMEILSGNYIRDSRFFLEALVGKKDSKVALNEVVIHSGSVAQLIEYDLYINSKFVYRQRADGIIISTPTGSTAYSLSGNGPIVHPDVKSITLLPMFPHSLNARPLLVNDSTHIKIVSQGKAYISLDSHTNILLKPKEEVRISKAYSELTLIHPKDHDFFSACRTKLGWSHEVLEK